MRRRAGRILLVVLTGALLTGAAHAGWWDQQWEGRLSITVEAQPGVLAGLAAVEVQALKRQ